MVSEEHRTGLYVSIPVYFLLLCGCAFWAHRRMERMEHEGVSDKLAAHYLGGRLFGPIITAGTIFASLFSGYTVVGIPNEAFRTGWQALRWMPSFAYTAAAYSGTGLRLRKASVVRNHQTPADFITDRFQSQLLRYTIVFLQVIPSIIYVSAQVNALKNTFNSMFGLDPNSAYPAIVIMFVILMFEWAGGLSSVALTDSIQGFVMILSFIMLPSIMKKNFGGWTALDPETYPRPDFYQTPSKDQQWQFWQFSLINMSFFTLPHFMQRTYAARDLVSLKAGYYVMTIGPWVTMFVGVFLGTVGVQMLAGEAPPSSPFTSILNKVMDLGGFPKGVAIIAFTASLAAIMSTADSLIIAISQIVTAEIAYPQKPDATPRQIAWIGRLVSLLTCGLALVIGLLWRSGITALGRIQFALSMQAVPAFLIGLYATQKNGFHPWCLSFGAMASTIYIFIIYFGYLDKNVDSVPINPGITGLGIQLFVSCTLELFHRRFYRNTAPVESVKEDQATNEKTGGSHQLLFPNRPDWDIPHLVRFGERTLTPQLLTKMMDAIKEPFVNAWYALLIFITVSLVTPLTAEKQPGIDADGNFVSPPPVYNGLPWWAFKITLLVIIPYALVLLTLIRMPNKFPIDEEKIEKEGIDPDIVELTPEEMGRRTSYDETNVMALRRRSSIRKTMSDRGLMVEPEPPVAKRPGLGDKKLSSLVLGTVHMDAIKENDEEIRKEAFKEEEEEECDA